MNVSPLAFALVAIASVAWAAQRAPGPVAPSFHVDPGWPKPLPNRWLVGAVVGVHVDSRDHGWIVHRPGTLQPNETRSIWRAAPPVLEFDADGTLVSSWGGPGAGYEWPDLEHGIHVDDKDFVWVAGGGEKDAHILKFTRAGKFVLQIGRKGQSGASPPGHRQGRAEGDRPRQRLALSAQAAQRPPAGGEVGRPVGRAQHDDLVPPPPELLRGHGHMVVHRMGLRPGERRHHADPKPHGWRV